MSVLDDIRRSIYASSTQPKGDNASRMQLIKDHFTNTKAAQMDYYSSINLHNDMKSKFFCFPP